jgi:uncharacterized membrane protein YbhN (UPF0104 family)
LTVNLQSQSRWQRMLKWLKPAVVLTIVVGAMILLYRELRQYRFEDVRDSFFAISWWRLLACFGLTIVNYLILVGYDLLAVRSMGHPLPLHQVAMASFTGFVTSYNFGAILGGTPVRVRLYSSWGMTADEIVRLMVMIGTTFWFGIFALAGIIFVIDPFPIPEELHLPVSNVRPIGYGLLLIVLAYVGVSFVWRKPIKWRGREVAFPRLTTIFAQILVSAADLVVAAGSLFVLLPDSVELTFSQFLGIYLLAVVAVIFTHAPGGVGIFELTILMFCGGTNNPDVLAVLLVFRVIYYLFPLAITIVLLIGKEWQVLVAKKAKL